MQVSFTVESSDTKHLPCHLPSDEPELDECRCQAPYARLTIQKEETQPAGSARQQDITITT